MFQLPQGTVLNAEKAMDSRAALRVPFTEIVSTGLKVRGSARRTWHRNEPKT